MLDRPANSIRLFALLLMLLELSRPTFPSPLRPICDLRVLNHFIQEARDAETAMKVCREGCTLSQSVTVPQTSVDFDVWDSKNASEQAQEVQSGVRLLEQALNQLRTSVTNTELHSHIDSSIRNLLSTSAVLRSLNIQEYSPPATTVELEGSWKVSSATELLQVHLNFYVEKCASSCSAHRPVNMMSADLYLATQTAALMSSKPRHCTHAR
uniref:Erythropoietin n=1 Tax=Neogobius melanostomus TaxID=47308 RepID=A0A8C6UQ43_9GOBI